MVISRSIGARVKRKEDPRLITGGATYVDDVRLPDMLYMAILRSPHAHARIKKIDTRKGRRHPGVVAVLAGKELRRVCGPVPADYVKGNTVERSPLTWDKVRHVGDPVAAVVATDRYIAWDALEFIQVEYEPLPAVVDLEQAVRRDAPRIHEQFKSNVAYRETTKEGDVEKAFKEADVVVKGRFTIPRLIPMAIEPRAVVAQYQPGPGTLTVWCTTQNPHILRARLASMLRLPENKVRAIAPEVGGGFGSKIDVYPEEAIVSVFSMKLGRPVKWCGERREEFLSTIHGRGQIQEIELAVKRDGTVLGLRSHIIADLGAYCFLFTPIVPTLTTGMLTQGYHISNIEIHLTGVYTTKTPYDAYRGAGRPEATYLMERGMDLVAHELNLDPAEVRRKNFISPGAFPYKTATGITYDSGDYEAPLNKALERAAYERLRQEQRQARREGKLMGIGLACYVEICGMGPSADLSATGGWESATVRVERTGKVTVLTGISPHGQGQETTFAQIVTDYLGVPFEDVVVHHGDTAMVQEGIGTWGSRGLAVGGAALVKALVRVREKAQQIAAHLLGVRPDQVEFMEGRFYHVDLPEKFVSFPDVAAKAYIPEGFPRDIEPGLEASAYFEPPSATFPFGTHIAVVDVDPETGEVTLRRFIAVDDVGVRISPLLVEGQVHGGVAQGIAQALHEEVVYDENGQLVTGTLMDYAVPTAEMLPPFETDSTVTPTPVNVLGAKGAGEVGAIGAPPAVVNAVADALASQGIHPRDVQMPVKAGNVWSLIQKAKRRRRGG